MSSAPREVSSETQMTEMNDEALGASVSADTTAAAVLVRARHSAALVGIVGLLVGCEAGTTQRINVSDPGLSGSGARATTSPPSHQPTPSLDDRLSLLAAEHYEEAGYRHVAGVVKNISGDELTGLTVVASWFTDWDDFVTTRKAPAEGTPLAPGDSLSFDVRGPANPYASKFSVRFNDALGDEIPTRTTLDVIRETESILLPLSR